MRIEHLEECIHLAQSLNFTRTAQHFFISQPVLSKHIAQIEREVGAALFTREQHHVQLTTAGEVFVAGARKVVNNYQKVIEDVNQCISAGRQSFRVGYLLGVCGPRMGEINQLFSQQHPEVDPHYHLMEFADIERGLSEDKIDIGITGICKPVDSNSFESALLFHDRLFLSVSFEDELAKRTSVSLADLAGKTLILPSSTPLEPFFKEISDRALKQAEGLSIRMGIEDINSMPILLRQPGHCVLGYGHLQEFYENQFAFIPVEDLAETVDFVAIWRNSSQHPYFEDFVQILRKCLAKPKHNTSKIE